MCTCMLFMVLSVHAFTLTKIHADARITHLAFVHKRNKLVLEMLMSSCFTYDEGELQTAEF